MLVTDEQVLVRGPSCRIYYAAPTHTLPHTRMLQVLVAGWFNWPHLAHLESGGVGLHACDALANQAT